MASSTVIGLAIDTCSTLICQTGYAFQKLGHKSVEQLNAQRKPDQKAYSGFCTGKWVLGMTLTALGGCGHAGKSLSLLLPLGQRLSNS